MVIHGEVEGEDRLRWSLENRAIVTGLACVMWWVEVSGAALAVAAELV